MSRSIGVLTLDLVAKSTQFEQGMSRAQRKVGDMDRDLQRMVARADKAALALATFAAGAAAGLVALTARTARAMDATSKMADQIGTTTEALTGLRFAAQQFANVSDQQFDMALRRMTRRIEEAAQGSGGAKAAFDAMGLSARELSRLSADEQFMRIADAMQKTDTQAQRLKNTMAIFDTEGMPLVNALVQGSEELEKNIELATRYGVVLSTQAAKSAEQFATNLSRLGSIQEGFRQQLTTAMLPALEKASGYMLGVAESALEVGNSRDRLQSFSDAAVAMVDDIARSYAGLLEIGRGVMEMLEALDEAALGWLEPFKQETQSAASILSQSFSESILNTAREIDKLVGFAGGVRAAWEAASSSIPGFFKQAWNNVLIGAAEFVNNLAELVNPMLETLGMDGFSRVSWGENIISGQRSITEAFREGYEAAKEASGMAARVQAAYDNVGESAASAAASIAGTNGAGGGGRNLTGSTKAAQKASEDFRKERQRALQSQYQSISALHDQAQAMEDQIAVYGLGKTAIEDLTIARLEEQAAMLQWFEGSEEVVEGIKREIEARKRLRTAIGSLEQKEAERQAWEDWARDVEQIFDRVGQSLTDAIFDGGKNGKELLRDLFKSLTFNVLINPIMNQMQGWVTNQLGGMFGVQNPQQQGTSFGMPSFGTGTGFGNAISWAGNTLGSSGLGQFGAGMTVGAGGAFTDAGAQAFMDIGVGGSSGFDAGNWIGENGANILSAASAIYDISQGNYGRAAGTVIGSFLPIPGGPIIGGTIGGFVDSIFGDDEPRTRHAQQSAAHMLPDGSWEVSSWDDRQDTASQEAARDFAQAAVKHANDLFERIGIDAGIHSFQTLMESSILGDKQGVGSSGQVRIGDVIRDIGLTVEPSWTKHGVGGWSEAEMLPRLQADIQLTLLEAFQAAGDELPTVLSDMLADVDIRSLGAEEAQALAQSFQMVVDQVSALQVALEQLPFEQLRDLSFDAAANLIHYAGGLEALNAGMTSYFENFYSQEEQLAFATEQVGKAFDELGLTMPDVTQGADAAKQAYRAIVESLDVTTEEGQRAYATLMTLSGGFAQLVTGLEEIGRAARTTAINFDSLIGSFMGLAADALSAVQQRGQERIAKLSESFAKTDAIFNTYRSQVQQLESQWGSLITTMERSMRDLRGQVDASARLQYDQARAVISTAVLTGQLPQTADLGEAIRIAQQGVTGGRYASAFEQREAYLKLANELEALQGIAQPELDTARASLEQLEKQYNKLRGIEDLSDKSLVQLEKQLGVALSAEAAARVQIERIERQIAMAQLSYQQLVGINEELSTLPGALQALANAISAANAAREAADKTDSVSREARYLANNPDVLDAYLRGEGGNMTAEELARYHYETYGKKEGRSFDVGTSYVPYDMMANIHQGEIIIDPRSSDILRRYGIGVQGGGNKELVAEVRQLRAEVAGLRAENKAGQFAIAKYTQKAARIQEKWDAIGMPQEVSA